MFPALFIGHGSPMNVLNDNAYTRAMQALGKTLPRPRAILVVSAHWMTNGETLMTKQKNPPQIYDFYGFPDELYAVKYEPVGDTELAKRITKLIPEIDRSDDWGNDHAAWAVLKHMYPHADIPTIELSIDVSKPMQYHYALGKKLVPLRNEEILIIGSGNMVHNLFDFAMDEATVFPWATAADAKMAEYLETNNHQALIDFDTHIPQANKAIPTVDHYIPLMYILGLQQPGEKLTTTHASMQNGSMSMRCIQLG